LTKFLIADQGQRSQRDRIREAALREYILPQIENGKSTAEIKAGELGAILQIQSNAANLCGALSEPKFLEGAGLSMIGSRPADSTAAVFSYTILEPLGLPIDRAMNLVTMLLGDARSKDANTVW
jgi:hypothetical protein